MSDLMASAFASFLYHRKPNNHHYHNTPSASYHVLHPPLQRLPSANTTSTSPFDSLIQHIPSSKPTTNPLTVLPHPEFQHVSNHRPNSLPKFRSPVLSISHLTNNSNNADSHPESLQSPDKPPPNDDFYTQAPLSATHSRLNTSKHSSAVASHLPEQVRETAKFRMRQQITNDTLSTAVTNSSLSIQNLTLLELEPWTSQKPKTSTPRPYACSHQGCSATFIKQNHLSRHVRIVHNKERPYHCIEPGCGSKFGSKSHLGDHIHAVHMRIKKFKCGMCNASWSKKFNMKKHIMVRHRGEKPFRCQQCQLSFGTRSHATRHEMKVHKRLSVEGSPDVKQNVRL